MSTIVTSGYLLGIHMTSRAVTRWPAYPVTESTTIDALIYLETLVNLMIAKNSSLT